MYTPYTSLLYRETGVNWSKQLSLFVTQNIDYGVLTCTHNQCFEQKSKNIKFLQLNVSCVTVRKTTLRVRLWPCKIDLNPPVTLCY